MAGYRTHIKIVGDILTTTRDEEGSTVTHLVRTANIPHCRISGILRTLVSQGLLEVTHSRGSNMFMISKSGREFLQAYYEFADFADNYGLGI